MPDQTAALAIASLRPELLQMEALLDAQSNTTRQFLRLQAQRIAEAMQHKTGQVRFTLPDRINNAAGVQLTIDAGQREQSVGGGLSLRRRSVHDVGDGLRQRLDELRAASEDALQVCADLIMHACARFIVHDLLPAGRSVTYTAEESGDIPAQPADSGLDPESAITQPRTQSQKKAQPMPGAARCRCRSRHTRGAFTCRNGWRWTTPRACWWAVMTKPKA